MSAQQQSEGQAAREGYYVRIWSFKGLFVRLSVNDVGDTTAVQSSTQNQDKDHTSAIRCIEKKKLLN